jgi:CYTH domain-containing protein
LLYFHGAGAVQSKLAENKGEQMTAGEALRTSNAPYPQEIERKFLVQELPPGIDSYPAENILQGYVAIEESGTEVRLRARGTGNDAIYSLTVKSKGDLVRGEHETAITSQQFHTLWPATARRRIEKMRTTIPQGAYAIEVDQYLGSLAGHIVAEVEFPGEQAAAEFVPPLWFGEEVTAVRGLKNQQLALHGWPDNL